MEISILKWDSDFFKKTVAKINISKNEDLNIAGLVQYCKQQLYKLLYVFVDADNITLAQEAKLHWGSPINQKIILHIKNLHATNIPFTTNERIQISNATKTTLPAQFYNQILDLTLKAGAYSRFKLDKKIDNNCFEEMYNIWVNAIVYGNDYKIIVAKDKIDFSNEIKGFLAYKIIDSGYQIDFMSIHEDYKSQGVGKAFVKIMMDEINSNNYILTETHKDNIAIFKFFTSLGFSVKQVIDIYHVHL